MPEECSLMTHRSSESLRSGLHPGAKSNYLQIRYSCPTYMLTIGRPPVRSRQNSREISDITPLTRLLLVNHRFLSGVLETTGFYRECSGEKMPGYART